MDVKPKAVDLTGLGARGRCMGGTFVLYLLPVSDSPVTAHIAVDECAALPE